MASHEIEARRKKTGEDETKLERERGDKREAEVEAGLLQGRRQLKCKKQKYGAKNAQNKTLESRGTEQKSKQMT